MKIQKIYDKIESAISTYGKNAQETEWKQNRKYKSNLKKKGNPYYYLEYIPDYCSLAKSSISIQKSHGRPMTAFAK